jgi:prophage regulatory protein
LKSKTGQTTEVDKPKKATSAIAINVLKKEKPFIDFGSLSDDAHLRLKQFVPGWLPLSGATVWRGVADQTFPSPKKLSRNCTAWRVGDLRQWLATRPPA